MFTSYLDTCDFTCKEKVAHGIVAVVTEINFGALEIGVKSIEKRTDQTNERVDIQWPQ